MRMENLKDRFKNMSAKQKAQYIWDYYKFHIIIGIIVIYAVTTFIHGRLTAKTTVFRLVMIDSNVTELIEGSLLDGFPARLESYDPDKEQMVLDADYDLDSQGFSVYTTEQLILAEYNVGSIDGTIAPKKDITSIAETQAFGDLREILPEETMKKITSRGIEILYNKYEDPATGEIHEYPFAVNISLSPCIQSGFTESTGNTLSYYDEDCYYAICPNSSNLENSIAFLEYLLDC